MERQWHEELDDEHLLLVRRKVLTSLKEHWEGLILFVDHPEIPMDNNTAERALRGPVVGRKNFYGSGAQWSGEFTAMLFTIFQTLLLWNVNPQTWLECFFRACAEQGGTPLDDVSSFLPWNMTPEDLDTYGRAPPETPSAG
jgi:transposase